MINRIKDKIHAFVFWQTSIGEVVNKIYDLNLFYKYSFTQNNLKTKEKFESAVVELMREESELTPYKIAKKARISFTTAKKYLKQLNENNYLS